MGTPCCFTLYVCRIVLQPHSPQHSYSLFGQRKYKELRIFLPPRQCCIHWPHPFYCMRLVSQVCTFLVPRFIFHVVGTILCNLLAPPELVFIFYAVCVVAVRLLCPAVLTPFVLWPTFRTDTCRFAGYTAITSKYIRVALLYRRKTVASGFRTHLRYAACVAAALFLFGVPYST